MSTWRYFFIHFCYNWLFYTMARFSYWVTLLWAKTIKHTESAVCYSPASASRHALHLCPVRGLDAYYPLSSKWPLVPCTWLVQFICSLRRRPGRDMTAIFMRKNDRGYHWEVLVIVNYAIVGLFILCWSTCLGTQPIFSSVYVFIPLIFCGL